MIKRITFTTILAISIGLFFCFIVSFSLYQSEKKAAAYELQKDIDRATLAFSRELTVTTDLLYVMQNKAWNDHIFNKKSFEHLAQKLFERLPYIHSIRWLNAVKVQDKIAYENKMSEQYIDYSIRTKKTANFKQTHYFPITFTTNKTLDPQLQGLDLLSLAMLSDEIKMSWHQGIPIAIHNTELQHALLDEHGFFVLSPIFSNTAKNQNERIANIEGMFLLLLDIPTMFESLLSNTMQEPLKLSLQEYNKDNVKVVYENVEGVLGRLIKKMRYNSTPFFFGGKEWQMSGIPSKEYLKQRMTHFPYLIFILGSSIFFLMGYLLHMIQSKALNIHYQVDEKTKELRNVNRKLEKMSRSDGLTGLFNRAYFDESLDSEVKRAQRDELPISLLIIEIDNAEDYYHCNGHNAGDNTIRMIGLALLETLKRPSDMIARYSDGAFAVMLPNTKNGASIAEHCIETVRKLKIPFVAGKEEQWVSVSIGGVTSIETDKIDGAKLRAFTEIALSKAIAQGRNRIQWIFSPETS